jgi:hypothetical protein
MGYPAMERNAVTIQQERAEQAEKGGHLLIRHSGLPFCLRSLCFLLFNFLLFVFVASAADQRTLVLVIGAPGEPEYAEQFSASADLWKRAATNGGFNISVIGESTNADNDRAELLSVLTNQISQSSENSSKSVTRGESQNQNMPTTSSPSPPRSGGEGRGEVALGEQGEELWLVFIGHGTFDGHSAKFNLRGPDISADDLAAALKPCKRPLAVIQCASASGPFLNALSAPGRVIITATKSGYEVNATRFGNYFARAVADPAADLDKDGQTSLLEAFLMASRQVDDFYTEAGRMATEHALLDDNGDGLGTPADWFKGVRAFKKAADGKSVDGVRAQQMFLVRSATEQELSPELRARRDELESQLSALRDRKNQMKEDDYYNQLEKILVEMAKLYEKK